MPAISMIQGLGFWVVSIRQCIHREPVGQPYYILNSVVPEHIMKLRLV